MIVIHDHAGPVLQVSNLSKAFHGVVALDQVSLEVRPGEVHAVMGENGAGKSTLMKILAGLLPPDAGEIRFQGRAVRIRSPHHAQRLGIAMIHQELMSFPNLTVAENLYAGREPVGRIPGWVDFHAMNRLAAQWLARLGASHIQPDHPMSCLSVADRQMVEIAKALSLDARILILDEPTSAISDREVAALFAAIRDLRQRGVAILYISHKMAEVFQLADTITVLRDGCRVATQPARDLDEKQLICQMVGRELRPLPAPARRSGGPVALAVRGLSCPGVFHNISLDLHQGEILGLAGLMGAGRTELAAALYGLAPASAGSIQVLGRTVRITSPREALAAGLGMVTEDRQSLGLIPALPVRHNLTLTSLGQLCRGPWIRQLAEKQVAAEQVASFRIRASSPEQRVRDLSGGNQQKVVFAKALLAGPRILILDEPTRGIDIGAKTEIYELILRLAGEGMAILLISSELPELLALSQRLLVMRQGALVAELDPHRTSPEEVLRHAMPESAAAGHNDPPNANRHHHD